MGIEPTSSAWKAEVLPLNYTREGLRAPVRKGRRPTPTTGWWWGRGFEPPKAEPSDLQSDPFDHSGTPPATKQTIFARRSDHVNDEFRGADHRLGGRESAAAAARAARGAQGADRGGRQGGPRQDERDARPQATWPRPPTGEPCGGVPSRTRAGGAASAARAGRTPAAPSGRSGGLQLIPDRQSPDPLAGGVVDCVHQRRRIRGTPGSPTPQGRRCTKSSTMWTRTSSGASFMRVTG